MLMVDKDKTQTWLRLGVVFKDSFGKESTFQGRCGKMDPWLGVMSVSESSPTSLLHSQIS